MRHIFLVVIAALIFAAPVSAGEYSSRALSGWFNVATPQGWTGRRYMDGDEIFAEEFDSNRDGRIDVWRFYRRGVLTSEERDIAVDGRVDYVSRYDPDSGNLVAVLRDTNRRGVNDVEIEYAANNRWEARQDRNLDGVTDRIVYVNARQDMFRYLDIDPAAYGDIASAIPRETWTEMQSDDGYTGAITDYYRYRRGVLTQYGEWNGRRVVWRRVPPDFIPPGTAPAPAQAAEQPRYPEYGDQYADQYGERFDNPYDDPYAESPRGRSATEEAIRNPFEVGDEFGDYDPYAGMNAAPPAARFRPGDGSGAGFDPDASAPAPSMNAGPVMTELPKYESFARSVPARMRPPGQR